MWVFRLPSCLWSSSSPCPICHPCPHPHSRPCPCLCSGPHTPPSTLRAVARSGGGGFWVVFMALPLIFVIPIPAAPCFHPTSSGLWRRFRVLFCWQVWHRSATGRSEAMWRGNGGLWGAYQAGIPLQGVSQRPSSVICPLFVVLHSSTLSFVLRCSSFVLRPSLFVVCCLLFVVHCSLFIIHCLLSVFRGAMVFGSGPPRVGSCR
jgi:hypothetical protein